MRVAFGLINSVLGLILLHGTTVAFRFPNEGRGRTMLRSNLMPPPPPSRVIRHFNGGRIVVPKQPSWRELVPQVRSRQSSRFRFPKQLTHLQPPPVTNRQHPQPRKLQWEPPVRTLQQNMDLGDDLVAAASDNQVRSIASSAAASASGLHSHQATTGSASSNNNPPSYIMNIDEVTCQRCEILNSLVSTGCCSKYNQCCQQNIPQHSQNQFQPQSRQPYYPLQGPQFGQTQFYQPRNSHQQGHAQVPAHKIFYTDNVNIYNKYDSQFNPGNVEPAYDIRDPNYDVQLYPDEDYLIEGELQPEEFDADRDRRSTWADVLGAVAISGISMGINAFARNAFGEGVSQREGPIVDGPQHRIVG